MIDGIIPFMPLTHLHLKKILQNYIHTDNNNIHISDDAIHYLLSSTFIEYFTVRYDHNNQEETSATTASTTTTESISIPNSIYATEGVQHLWDGSIRIIKRLLNKYPNNDEK